MHTSTVRIRTTITAVAAAGTIALIAAGCAGERNMYPSAAPSPLDSVAPAPVADAPDFDPSAVTDAVAIADPATEPSHAVRRYLSGELAGSFEQSYSALSSKSRQDAGSLADWSETASQRPTVVDFTIDETVGAPNTASAVIVPGEVTFEPRLDEVSGYVPQHASVEWRVVAEDGGWRVDLGESSLRPYLPDERGASEAAERWASARQACRFEGEYDGSLLGSPALGDALCGGAGRLRAGIPRPVDDAIATQIVAAFGPDALTWARSVPISGASELSVVTAPYGDQWVVVGVSG